MASVFVNFSHAVFLKQAYIVKIKLGDFWERHPGLSLAFDDKFVNRKDSSDMMNAIELYADPRSELSLEQDLSLRLEYIRKEYKDFDPDDKETKEMIKKYLSFVPEVEILYDREYKDLSNILTIYESIVPVTMKEAKDKLSGKSAIQAELVKLAKIRKEVATSRMVNDSAGVGGHVLSRIEAGLVGK